LIVILFFMSAGIKRLTQTQTQPMSEGKAYEIELEACLYLLLKGE